MRRRPRSVSHVMRRDFVTVDVGEGVGDALSTMRMARLRHLIVERDGVLVGILSYRDLQDRILESLEEPVPGQPTIPVRELEVSAAMRHLPYAVGPDAPLSEAAARLSELHIGCLPVVDREAGEPRLLGLVTETDLLRVAFARP